MAGVFYQHYWSRVCVLALAENYATKMALEHRKQKQTSMIVINFKNGSWCKAAHRLSTAEAISTTINQA